MLLVIGLSLGAEAAKQGWAGLLLRPGGENINTIPFLGDNNIVAVGMLMLLPVLVAVARTSKRRWARLGHRLVAIGVLYRSLSTYSRGGFLACAAVGGMYVLRSRHRLAAMLIVVTVAAGIAPVMPDAFWARIDTIFADADERDRSATGRLHFWSVAVDMARAHPLLGVGHWGYNHAYDAFDPTRGDFGQSRSVHSVWFGLLAELGYPGLLLFLCILLAHWGAIRTVRLASQRNAVPAELGHYAFALEASLVAFVVGGTFLPIHYNEMVWQFFALGIALHRACGTAEVSADHEGVRNVPISGAYLQPHQAVSRYSATISRDPMWPFAP